LITKIRKNRHNQLMPLIEKRWLRQRAIIAAINDPLKNIQPVEHRRHRRVINAMVNILAALAADTHQPSKPSLNIHRREFNALICIE
jgi:hypothetical protein